MISISQLRFGYGRNRIYDDFSLDLSNPGVIGLFGRNGSGKSTLLKILAGLLYPHAGTVQVLGFTPSQRLPEFLQQVYMVPEEFHLPNISLAALLKTQAPFYPQFSLASFQRYVDIFEIPQTKGFATMSLGQKKKAVIAFALAACTPLLLMDEPTNGLDIIGRTQFKTIMALPENIHRMTIISTHQAHDLESLMSHILFVDGGKIALSADMNTLKAALISGTTDDQIFAEKALYHEVAGQQWSYVAVNDGHGDGAVQLELLYKALSIRQAAVLEAMAAHDPGHGENA